jgi:hypothetical protein
MDWSFFSLARRKICHRVLPWCVPIDASRFCNVVGTLYKSVPNSNSTHTHTLIHERIGTRVELESGRRESCVCCAVGNERIFFLLFYISIPTRRGDRKKKLFLFFIFCLGRDMCLVHAFNIIFIVCGWRCVQYLYTETWYIVPVLSADPLQYKETRVI